MPKRQLFTTLPMVLYASIIHQLEPKYRLFAQILNIPLSSLTKSIFIENADIITISVHAGISRAEAAEKLC